MQKRQLAEPVEILEVRRSGDKVYLRVEMSPGFYSEVHEFLDQKGYVSFGRESEGMSFLLQFGISEESRTELERNQSQMWKESSQYAATTFQTAEYYARNTAITLGLHLHLQENRALKKELKEKGLDEFASKDEWDEWDEDAVDAFYRRYVFRK